jgi:ATP-dependent Clp protease ATP-binding subunit ClpC
LTRSLVLVAETGADTITPEHLLWGVATEQGSVGSEILRKSNISPDGLREHIGVPLGIPDSDVIAADALPRLSEQSKRVIEKAVLTATVYEHRYIGTEHLIAGILQVSNKPLAAFFKNSNVNIDEIRHQLNIIMKGTQAFPKINQDRVEEKRSISLTDADLGGHDLDEDLAHTDQPTLEYFGVELTTPSAIKDIDPVIGRDKEIQRVIEILTRRTKNNPILVGDPGVGKTAIIEGLARRIVEGNVPASLMHKRVFALDLGGLIAGTVYRGEFEGRMKQIIDEVREQPDIILFIDEVHMIMGAGSASGSLDAANMLKPALARGWIRCIGATTPPEYKKHIESDGALERRFQNVSVNEPSLEDTKEILRGLTSRYEEYHHVTIPEEVIDYAVNAANRHIHDNALPDKAIDLIDEASAMVRVNNMTEGDSSWQGLIKDLRALREEKRSAVVEERFLDASMHKQQESQLQEKIQVSREKADKAHFGILTIADIAKVLERQTGVRVNTLLTEERKALENLSETIQSELFGQDDVVSKVSSAVRRARLGIQQHDRPQATFMFVGPSGTGKSELARLIAKHVFYDEKALIRLDMSEYAEGYSVSKLVGSPAGYVGYRDTARLTDSVKQRPHSVVLFDEIEKAHSDVHHLLLQILEHGELSDATGRNISFKNAIIVLTSNVGAEKFENGTIGFNETDSIDRSEIMRALKDQFRPELLNRLDNLHVFQPLDASTLKLVAEKELSLLQKHLKNQDISLNWQAAVIGHLVKGITETSINARTVKKHIGTLVADLIANHLLQNPDENIIKLSINKDLLALEAKKS